MSTCAPRAKPAVGCGFGSSESNSKRSVAALSLLTVAEGVENAVTWTEPDMNEA